MAYLTEGIVAALRLIRRMIGTIKRGTLKALISFPYFNFIKDSAEMQTQVTIGQWFMQKVIGINGSAYWPMHPTSKLTGGWRRVIIGIDVAPGVMPGCYIQAIGHIEIGDYTRIGPSVGIISANHDVYDARNHIPSYVQIGKYCWLGMGAKIMPGTVLGDFTIVAAGSVVTTSFVDGYCVIAGVPARLIKQLDPNQCIRYENIKKYYGYIPAERFASFAADHLIRRH